MSLVHRHVACVLVLMVGCDIEGLLGGGGLANRDELGIRSGLRDVDTLVIGRAADALYLDPARPTDSESAEVIEQIFDKLVHVGPRSSVLEPGLAVSWTRSDDGRVWTFDLRQGVTFHDGTPLDADAVVFSFERQRDPGHPYHRKDFTYWQHSFARVQAVEKVSEHRVRITIDRPYAAFLSSMAIFTVGVVSPAALRAHGDDFTRQPVGTGPYRFVSWDNGRIVLERNEDYWGRRPAFRRLVFQTIPDHRHRLVALESGALDIAHGILPEEMQFVALHPRLKLHRGEPSSVIYLALNNDVPPFDDVRVRRAINHAVNKQPIVQVLWQGMAEVAHSPLPMTQWGHYVVREPYLYDPARARALLAEARADGRLVPGRVYNLHVPATPRPYLPSPEQLGRVIQANLRDVGIETQLIVQPFADHVTALKWGEHDLAIYGWVGDSGDPDNFLHVLLDRDNTQIGRASNIAFFRDPEVHALLARAQELESKDTRVSLYARAQAIIHEQAPWVPLAHAALVLAMHDDLGGIGMSPSGFLRYADVFRKASRAASHSPARARAPEAR